jgi:hypothetical protein
MILIREFRACANEQKNRKFKLYKIFTVEYFLIKIRLLKKSKYSTVKSGNQIIQKLIIFWNRKL